MFPLILRLFLGTIIGAMMVAILKSAVPDLAEGYYNLVHFGIAVIWTFSGWPKSKPKLKVEEVIPNPNNARFVLDGVHDILEVFDAKIAITSKKSNSALFVRGSKGTKSIPFTSITAIQLRMANPINGYIQFSILGGRESTGGIIAAIEDENTVFFGDKRNELAKEIVAFIESKIGAAPIQAPAIDISAQIQSLDDLRHRGVLSQEEFETAKKKLLG